MYFLFMYISNKGCAHLKLKISKIVFNKKIKNFKFFKNFYYLNKDLKISKKSLIKGFIKNCKAIYLFEFKFRLKIDFI